MARIEKLKNPEMGTVAALHTPSDISRKSTEAIAMALNVLIADAFALYLKTKNFHWHMSGPHFRDYHLLLDEQSNQILATVDPLAERVRKLGHPTLRSIGHISKLAHIHDNDESFMPPLAMLAELTEDNRAVAAAMREAHELCEDNNDPATASLLEMYIDETERRIWFLFEASRSPEQIEH